MTSLTGTDPHRDNLRGAAILTLSMAGFTLNDAAIKLAMRALPFGEAIFLRGLLISLVLLALALRGGALMRRVGRRDGLMLALRMVGEVGSTVLYLQALRHMAIGDLSAVMQILPLAVTFAAALVFRERLDAPRLIAIGVGLVGVLLILRPGTPRFDVWAWMALGSVALIVLRELATRGIGREVASSTIALSAAIGVTLTGAAIPSGPWRWPTAEEAGLIALAAGLLSVGYVAAVAAMRVGELSFSAPFRYTSLLIAIALGLVVFGEVPDLWTMAGSALVVAAGLYVIAGGVRRR